MKKNYKEIWNLAKPYYKIGRPMDIDHIEWMMQDALLVCEKEKIDETLLLPLVILHDVGYAKVPKDNPFKIDLRKAHMLAGTIIAKKILEKVEYPKEKIDKIAYFISVHDNWALGDNEIYSNDIILGVFHDLDFIWMATPIGFKALMKILKKNKKQMIEYIETDDKLTKRPFACRMTKELYEEYMKERKLG